MSNDELNIRSLSGSTEDLAKVKACFDDNASPKSLSHLQWQYAREDYPTDILCAIGSHENQERIAGIYAVFRSVFHVGDELVEGCQSLDTITDVHFRRRGLFKRLATELYERLAAEQVRFVYGFPNGASNPGFVKHLGWNNLDPVPYLVRPIRTSYLQRASKLPMQLPSLRIPSLPESLTQAVSKVRIEEAITFSDEHTHLWDEFRREQRIAVALRRSASYLNWRYRDHATFDYTTLQAVDHQDQLKGWVTLRVADKHGGKIAYIMELVHSSKRIGVALLNSALKRAAEQGAEIAIAWNFSHTPNHTVYMASLFAPLPRKLWPVELHFGYRSFQPAAELNEQSNWYISYSDSDTV